MSTLAAEAPRRQTLADLVHDLGDIPLDRIRLQPPPGTATVADVIANQGCELVDGTLVEKAMGLLESFLAVYLSRLLDTFVDSRNLGMVAGEQGTMRILTGLVRIPDVAFISWDRFPGRRLPDEPVPNLVPDLAIEVISLSNTNAEMARKRREYFHAGVRLVWMVDRFDRNVMVYTSETDRQVLTEADTLEGDPVLPGFTLPVRDLFARLERHG